jgi:hypothetical protein
LESRIFCHGIEADTVAFAARNNAGDLGMRRLLLTTAAVGVMACPALAQDNMYYGGPPSSTSNFYSPVVGGVELSLGRSWFDDDHKNYFQGAGQANVALGNDWNILAEVGGSAIFENGNSLSHYGANVHLWKRSGLLRWGIYGGVDFGGYYDLTIGRFGVEAEADVTAKITIGGQVQYAFGDDDFIDLDAWTVRGWWDYYFTDNTKFTGELAYVNVNDEGDGWGTTKRITHRFDGTPLSVFGQIEYANIEDEDKWGAGLGLTINLDGNGTLKSYDEQVPFDALGGGLLLGVNF